MTQVSGFQQSGILKAISGYPGDIVDGKTVATLGADGYQAYGDVGVAKGCFALPSGNQCASNNTDGTSGALGIVARNENVMNWTDSFVGFSALVPDGKIVTVVKAGRVLVNATGVNASGVASNLPNVGDILFISNTDGTIVTAPAGTATVTGYTLLPNFRVLQNSGFYTFNQTYAQFQALIKVGTY
jgi:hypothetical protein